MTGEHAEVDAASNSVASSAATNDASGAANTGVNTSSNTSSNTRANTRADTGANTGASKDSSTSENIGEDTDSTVDLGRIRAAVSEMIAAIGDDATRPGLVDTPARVADAYAEFFAGIGDDPLRHLADTETLTDAGQQPGELIMMRSIDFRSMCEHHLLPFLGIAHIAYLPRDRVVGLGKLPRVVETLAARPQIQERLTEQIADTIAHGLDTLGVLVVLEASHGCVTARDIRQRDSTTVTLAARGNLAEPAARAEAMALIGKA